MESQHRTARVETLLEHAGWLRKLARSLVGDGPRAEDLSQATWVRALEQPPDNDRPVRGWLATVMRNVLRQELRSEQRRTDRERRAYGDSRGLEDDDALELLSKATMHRELVQAVLELDEPYRRTILLRYFEALTPKRIAAKDRIPVSTVKTRIARALERLRSALDGRYDGNRSAWLAAMIPAARRPEGLANALPQASLGALAVNTKLFLAAVLGVAIVGATWATVAGDASPDPAPQAPSLTSPSGAHPVGARSTLAEPAPERIPGRTRRVEPARTEEVGERGAGTNPAGSEIRGRVVDVDGSPVAGVDVLLSGERTDDASFARAPLGAAVAVTSTDGTFRAHVTRGRALAVRDERYVTVLGGSPVRTGKETVIVVAPRIELAGRVVDEAGVGVAGATLTLAQPADLRARLGAILDYSFEVPFAVTSEADGAFRFASAPAITGGELRVTGRDYERSTEAATLQTRRDLLFVLERREAAEGLLEGVVLDPHGFPAEGARVSLGIDSRVTGADGGFTFLLDDPESYNRTAASFFEVDAGKLIAIKPGYLPGELTAPERDSEGNPRWSARVVLRLGTTPLSIAGRVRDADGTPKPGARVWIADPTFFGGRGTPPDGGFPRMTHVETELAEGDPSWHYTESDEQGRFRIEGLLDREYVVQAMDTGNLLRVEEGAVRAGDQDLELILPAQALYGRMRGIIADGKGRPVENASVFPMCDAFRTRVAGQVIGTRHASVEGVRTDASGRFELHRVPRNSVYLRVDHPDTIPLEWGRHVEGGLESLVGRDHDDVRITVSRRCHFQVELSREGEADELAVLDADGSELVISEFLGNGRREASRHALHEGKSNPLAVADVAATLVLFRSGEEVRRYPLSLDPGEPTTLRP